MTERTIYCMRCKQDKPVTDVHAWFHDLERVGRCIPCHDDYMKGEYAEKQIRDAEIARDLALRIALMEADAHAERTRRLELIRARCSDPGYRPRALDLFCGGGLAGRGLVRAGFDVTGVDISDHAESYPGKFVQSDVFDLDIDRDDYDLIWASPPCQSFSDLRTLNAVINPDGYNTAPDLVDATRRRIIGHPITIMENVRMSPLRSDVILSGPTVGLEHIVRFRKFEISWAFGPYKQLPYKQKHIPVPVYQEGRFANFGRYRMERNRVYLRAWIETFGEDSVDWNRMQVKRDVLAYAMGLDPGDPATSLEICEGIPPAYAEFLANRARVVMGLAPVGDEPVQIPMM